MLYRLTLASQLFKFIQAGHFHQFTRDLATNFKDWFITRDSDLKHIWNTITIFVHCFLDYHRLRSTSYSIEISFFQHSSNNWFKINLIFNMRKSFRCYVYFQLFVFSKSNCLISRQIVIFESCWLQDMMCSLIININRNILFFSVNTYNSIKIIIMMYLYIIYIDVNYILQKLYSSNLKI